MVLKFRHRGLQLGLTLGLSLPSLLMLPPMVTVASAKPKGQTAAQLLKIVMSSQPGKERDEAVDALIELGDPAWPEVRGKLDAIANLKGGEDTLVDLLLGWGQTSYDEAVTRAPKLGDPAARRLVKQILRYKEDARRTRILMSMLPRQDDELLLLVLPEVLAMDPPPVLARLLQLVDDPRANLRAYAIDTLVARKYVDALPTLVRLLGIEQLHPRPENLNSRLKLIGAVSRLGQDRDAAVDPLLAALAVPDQRDAALDGLMQVGAPAVKAAIFLLRTADRARLETALAVVSHLKVQAAPQLLPLVQSTEPRTRNLAFDVLAHIAVPEVRGDLIKMVREKKIADLRQGVLLCLTLYDASVRNLLLDLMKDPDVTTRRLAVEQLWRLADPETFAALRHTATRDSDLQTRKMAVQAMVGVGDPKALELLRKLAIVNNQEERIAILTTIGRLDDLNGIPALAAQLSDPSDEIFRAAITSLRRLTFHSGPRRESEWLGWMHAEKGREKDPLEEIAPQQGRYQVDGREMTYLEVKGGSDHTYVAVSGPPFRDSSHFAPFIWQLAEDDRVIVPQRSAAEHLAMALSETDRAHELAALIDHLRTEKVVLLADAAGAHLAITYANKHPEQISHVVLTGPFPTAEAIRRLPGEVLAAMPLPWRDDFQWAIKQAGLLVPEMRQRVLSRGLISALLGDPEQARRIQGPSGTGLTNLFEDGFDSETFERAAADAAADDVREVRVPTLLLLGEKAPWAASTLRDMTAMNAGHKATDAGKVVTVQRLNRSSAMPLLEQPVETLAAIRGFVGK